MFHRVYCLTHTSNSEIISLLVNDYLTHLSHEKRKELKEELTYNLPLKNEIYKKFQRLYDIFSALLDEDNDKLTEVKKEIEESPKEKNPLILEIYDYYLSQYWDDAENDMEDALKQYFKLSPYTLDIQYDFKQIVKEMI